MQINKLLALCLALCLLLGGCAQAEASRALNEIITEDALEDMLEATYGMATAPAKELIMEVLMVHFLFQP